MPPERCEQYVRSLLRVPPNSVDVWSTLLVVVGEGTRAAGGNDAHGWAIALNRRGIDFSPPSSSSLDIVRAHDRHSCADLAKIRVVDRLGKISDIPLFDGLYVERAEVENAVLAQLESRPAIAEVVGEAGTGKTSLLLKVRGVLLAQGRVCFFIRSSALLSPLGLSFTDLHTTLQELIGAVFLLDTVDVLAANEEATYELKAFLEAAINTGNSVVVTNRPYESETLGLTSGAIERGGGVVGKPNQVFRTRLSSYNDKELLAAIASHRNTFAKAGLVLTEEQAWRLATTVRWNTSLKALLAKPLTLRMIFECYQPEDIPQDLTTFALFERYWVAKISGDVRDVNSRGGENCSASACELALRMAIAGTVELSIESRHISVLVARGVLHQVQESVSFFHQTFLEYTVARSISAYNPNNAIALTLARYEKEEFADGTRPILEQVLIRAGLSGDQHFKTSLRTLFTSSKVADHQLGLEVFRQVPWDGELFGDVRKLAASSPEAAEDVVRRLHHLPSDRFEELIPILETVWIAFDNPRVRVRIAETLPRLGRANPSALRNLLQRIRFHDSLFDSADLGLLEHVIRAHSLAGTAWDRDRVAGLLRVRGIDGIRLTEQCLEALSFTDLSLPEAMIWFRVVLEPGKTARDSRTSRASDVIDRAWTVENVSSDERIQYARSVSDPHWEEAFHRAAAKGLEKTFDIESVVSQLLLIDPNLRKQYFDVLKTHPLLRAVLENLVLRFMNSTTKADWAFASYLLKPLPFQDPLGQSVLSGAEHALGPSMWNDTSIGQPHLIRGVYFANTTAINLLGPPALASKQSIRVASELVKRFPDVNANEILWLDTVIENAADPITKLRLASYDSKKLQTHALNLLDHPTPNVRNVAMRFLFTHPGALIDETLLSTAAKKLSGAPAKTTFCNALAEWDHRRIDQVNGSAIDQMRDLLSQWSTDIDPNVAHRSWIGVLRLSRFLPLRQQWSVLTQRPTWSQDSATIAFLCGAYMAHGGNRYTTSTEFFEWIREAFKPGVSYKDVSQNLRSGLQALADTNIETSQLLDEASTLHERIRRSFAIVLSETRDNGFDSVTAHPAFKEFRHIVAGRRRRIPRKVNQVAWTELGEAIEAAV